MAVQSMTESPLGASHGSKGLSFSRSLGRPKGRLTPAQRLRRERLAGSLRGLPSGGADRSCGLPTV